MTKFPTILLSLVLLGPVAPAQVKAMPSQSELDPILDNADAKLKAFLANLTEFKSEAAALDKQRLDGDLNSIGEVLRMIQATHSSVNAKNAGVNMQRLVVILSTVDDMALDAATWKSLAELRMCQQMIQHQNPSRYDQFSTRASMNLLMLREVGGQLVNPTFRLSAAMDEIVTTALDADEGKERKQP